MKQRPDIQFIPISTDAGKIRFFGTLMPAVLLMRASPWGFIKTQFARFQRTVDNVELLIEQKVDDASHLEDKIILVHRWGNDQFDPFAFAHAKNTLRRLSKAIQRKGYAVEEIDPLSPSLNLPRLASRTGLGTLSPLGLLVHPAFGPRLVLTGLKTNYPFNPAPRWSGESCNDCMACIRVCPQQPAQTGIVDLGQCHSCALCLSVCPIGKKA